MALESFGDTARAIDLAVGACHEALLRAIDPKRVTFVAGEPGVWWVTPGTIPVGQDGDAPAVVITLAVG
jgi:hypothetical protein